MRESRGRDSANGNVYTLVESMADSSGKNESEELLGGDEESERSIASVEDQLRKEMTIYEVQLYEKFICYLNHLPKI